MSHVVAFGFGAMLGVIAGYIEMAAEFKRRGRKP